MLDRIVLQDEEGSIPHPHYIIVLTSGVTGNTPDFESGVLGSEPSRSSNFKRWIINGDTEWTAVLSRWLVICN